MNSGNRTCRTPDNPYGIPNGPVAPKDNSPTTDPVEMPEITIRRVPCDDGTKDFDLKVTGTGLTSEDEMVVLLLMVVESCTGVSTDQYLAEVDLVRRIVQAAR
ncbi:hypothetical protein GCM10010124_25790 [Pilimelia terevasa]|uniref:Uncharacterized protein n=1 Tax=Pilimelia terevasa TaxID=53372 RepID=A0A8J3FK66_9ACTN|nr:hypothetical protein [Pilimelia terevasa]GGK31880.1 hypothetical protein GCM10010124_25790 [Pilimelia terevasa]